MQGRARIRLLVCELNLWLDKEVNSSHIFAAGIINTALFMNMSHYFQEEEVCIKHMIISTALSTKKHISVQFNGLINVIFDMKAIPPPVN